MKLLFEGEGCNSFPIPVSTFLTFPSTFSRSSGGKWIVWKQVPWMQQTRFCRLMCPLALPLVFRFVGALRSHTMPRKHSRLTYKQLFPLQMSIFQTKGPTSGRSNTMGDTTPQRSFVRHFDSNFQKSLGKSQRFEWPMRIGWTESLFTSLLRHENTCGSENCPRLRRA